MTRSPKSDIHRVKLTKPFVAQSSCFKFRELSQRALFGLGMWGSMDQLDQAFSISSIEADQLNPIVISQLVVAIEMMCDGRLV